ncbi:hypothetical protein AWW66_30490 [Micromonospora rosaria]|uniref:HTH araC/xylS-type domain-containing protein n=1 Tax=Micromonospora rosaria TaxID=47874 RepID=A0A136PIS5_9ACTN|nr:helix-turn-helix domain-containing protein [Micromonospora rosaria]KXK58315.1 hypothetical protein AWW66_30490 [Micromonospora rosaria]
MTLVVEFGPADAGYRPVTGQSLPCTVYGLHTRPRQRSRGTGPYAMEVALEPWAAFTLFGVPMHELTGVGTDLRDLPGVPLGDLTAAVVAPSGWHQRVHVLDQALTARLARGRRCAPYVRRAWHLLRRSGGTVPVSGLAAATNCSERSLERGFREQIGLPPKTVGRVVRFQRALRLLVSGRPAAEVAAACGYYDQAHLTREFSALTDRSVSRYLLERGADPGFVPPRPR